MELSSQNHRKIGSFGIRVLGWRKPQILNDHFQTCFTSERVQGKVRLKVNPFGNHRAPRKKNRGMKQPISVSPVPIAMPFQGHAMQNFKVVFCLSVSSVSGNCLSWTPTIRSRLSACGWFIPPVRLSVCLSRNSHVARGERISVISLSKTPTPKKVCYRALY